MNLCKSFLRRKIGSHDLRSVGVRRRREYFNPRRKELFDTRRGAKKEDRERNENMEETCSPFELMLPTAAAHHSCAQNAKLSGPQTFAALFFSSIKFKL